MKHSLPLSRKLFLSHFVSIFLLAGLAGGYLYFTAQSSMKRQLQLRLQNTATLISTEFDAATLEHIDDASDVNDPVYVAGLGKLRTYAHAISDVAFIYIMRLDEGKARFVIDSDESSRQAMPGRAYPDIPSDMREGFRAPRSDSEIVKDEWGFFMSGYAPLKNGAGRFLVGVDMRADEVSQKLADLRMAGGVLVVFNLLIAYLAGHFLAKHFNRPIDALVRRCEAIGAGDLESRIEMSMGDEMDRLIKTVNEMTRELQTSRQENLKVAASLESALKIKNRDQDR